MMKLEATNVQKKYCGKNIIIIITIPSAAVVGSSPSSCSGRSGLMANWTSYDLSTSDPSSPSTSPSSPSDCKDKGVIWDLKCYSYRKGWGNRLIKRNPCVPHTLNNVHYKYVNNNRLTGAFSMCMCNIETLGVA